MKNPWERFCFGLGARPVRAGSIGRDTLGYSKLTDLPPKKSGCFYPRPIHGEISAS